MINANLGKLDKKMNTVKLSFEAVLDLNVETWGLAALSQIGEMYNFFFTTIEKTPPPRFFDYEQQEIIKSRMIEQAAPLRLKAIESYKQCLKKSLKLQWFNKWTDLAERQVAKIAPEEFRYNIEERGAPVYLHTPKVQRGLILELPEPEVP